jgi:hypothetical protein
LFKEYKDNFSWNYLDLKGIPPWISQHHIELDTIIPHAHQVRYQMNQNYAIIVKQDLDKLLNVGFIASMEGASWLSTIIVVPKKNDKFRIFMNFRQKMIHILYPLLKRYWTKWQGMRSICFWMDFPITTKSWLSWKIGTRLFSSLIGELLLG